VWRIGADGRISRYGGDPGSQGVICDNSSNAGALNLATQYLCAPLDLAIGANGSPTILDSGHGQVLQFRQAIGSNLALLAGIYRISSNTQEGIAATSASLQDAQGIVWDPAGNLVIVDTARNRVRRVSGGIITTVAGTGTRGFAGDGGPAAAAQLSAPADAGYDAAGNLYLADTGNHRIRKVAVGTGIISTVAGTGVAGFSGDGGQASAAQLNGPADVLAVGNALLIADRLNHRVRMLDLATGVIATIAGTGATTATATGSAATSTAIPWPTKLTTDGGGTVLVGSQRGGSPAFIASWPASWSNGAGTGAVYRISLPAGR
jgi:hypothetical protein